VKPCFRGVFVLVSSSSSSSSIGQIFTSSCWQGEGGFNAQKNMTFAKVTKGQSFLGL